MGAQAWALVMMILLLTAAAQAEVSKTISREFVFSPDGTLEEAYATVEIRVFGATRLEDRLLFADPSSLMTLEGGPAPSIEDYGVYLKLTWEAPGGLGTVKYRVRLRGSPVRVSMMLFVNGKPAYMARRGSWLVLANVGDEVRYRITLVNQMPILKKDGTEMRAPLITLITWTLDTRYIACLSFNPPPNMTLGEGAASAIWLLIIWEQAEIEVSFRVSGFNPWNEVPLPPPSIRLFYDPSKVRAILRAKLSELEAALAKLNETEAALEAMKEALEQAHRLAQEANAALASFEEALGKLIYFLEQAELEIDYELERLSSLESSLEDLQAMHTEALAFLKQADEILTELEQEAESSGWLLALLKRIAPKEAEVIERLLSNVTEAEALLSNITLELHQEVLRMRHEAESVSPAQWLAELREMRRKLEQRRAQLAELRRSLSQAKEGVARMRSRIGDVFSGAETTEIAEALKELKAERSRLEHAASRLRSMIALLDAYAGLLALEQGGGALRGIRRASARISWAGYPVEIEVNGTAIMVRYGDKVDIVPRGSISAESSEWVRLPMLHLVPTMKPAVNLPSREPSLPSSRLKNINILLPATIFALAAILVALARSSRKRGLDPAEARQLLSLVERELSRAS